MIQLFVPLMAPSISGFRLDALAAVRTAARYMVSGSKKLRALDMAFGSCVDEAVTNPITLQISVAAVQVSQLSCNFFGHVPHAEETLKCP